MGLVHFIYVIKVGQRVVNITDLSSLVSTHSVCSEIPSLTFAISNWYPPFFLVRVEGYQLY